MSLPASSHRRRTAFTLIELLVVLAIISILAGLLFPVIGGVQDRARKTQALSDANQIITAVKAYYAEYGKYPVADGAQGTDILLSDATGYSTNRNSLVFNVLRALPGTAASGGAQWDFDNLNPKKVVYFEGKIVKDPANPKNGFPPMTSGLPSNQSYYDPWGQEYALFIDTNYDGKIDLNPSSSGAPFYNDAAFQDPTDGNKAKIRVGVGVASLGKDRARGKANSRTDYGGGNGTFKPSDDVITWQ